MTRERPGAGEVGAGVRRMGSEWVNWYLLEEDGAFTVVDTGLPDYHGQLPALLARLGVPPSHVRAIVLTHGHLDHMGSMARIQALTGADVFVHGAEAPRVRGEQPQKPPPGIFRNLWRPRMIRSMAHMIRNGGARKPETIDRVNEFSDADVLDVPGRLRVIHTPGHSPGHCALLFEAGGVLFSGDGLVTAHPWTDATGPQLNAINEDRDRAIRTLDVYGAVEAGLLLPGHGEPWSGSTADAVARARRLL